MHERATVVLSLACNNECVFCAQEGLTRAGVPVARQLEAARGSRWGVTFVGGEPTLDPRLVEHVALARRHGFRAIGVQTNGRLLSQPGYAQALAKAGATDVHLSIHAADAAAHDYHTGRPRSHVEALSGLGAARAAGLVVVVTTVLTRSNFRSLQGLPRLLADRGVSAWQITATMAVGRAERNVDRVVPPHALAAPFVLHALRASDTLGLRAWVRGLPQSALGPFARRALPAREAEIDLRDAPLAAMFVGMGPASAPTRPAVPDRERVSLPLAGKVRPAVAEVPAAAPRKSGEALREILPALFVKSSGS
ncbi:MAG: radical SAM protein [Polyangiaceae bacterium]|nr:radical SAM protein [Polyangiaceae bacterium]